MNDFFITYKNEIIRSIVAIVVLLSIRFIVNKFIKRVGDKENFNNARTILIIKYVNVAIIAIALLTGSIVWSIDFEDLGLVFSSVFAVLGVALFAQWSILSNVTAGVILFFAFPFKIGDRIRIQDKDFPSEAIIEDIKAFHIHLRTDEGELITYPNSLLLQKGIVVLNLNHLDDGKESV